MKETKAVVASAIAGVLAMGLAASANAAVPDAPKTWEKCAGVAKMGKNDCGTSMHGCAGMAKTDNDAAEWVYVPEGTCDKITGGKVIATKPAK